MPADTLQESFVKVLDLESRGVNQRRLFKIQSL